MAKRGIKILDTPLRLAALFMVSYILYGICRMIYYLENLSAFANTLEDNTFWDLLSGSLTFDTSAILYTNSVTVLAMLLPYPIHWRKRVALWIFTVVNSIAMILNLGDSVYFKYTGGRTTTAVFGTFQNESNIGRIFGTEIINHWYLFLVGIGLIACIWYAARFILFGTTKRKVLITKEKLGWKRVLWDLLILLIFAPFCVAGMRGGWTTAIRPITISNAPQYVAHPTEAALILNTPFSLIRTVGIEVYEDPKYFSDKEISEIYSPVHNSLTGSAQAPDLYSKGKGKNIVVLIVESFGREYIGAYNENLEGGKYKGYTPFMDKLYKESLSFDYTFANGRQSIDGMPSILSGIPRFKEPFFLTPASQNNVGGIASYLGQMGYSSAFFHGAENGSMGFEAFAKKTGFQKYYGRTEFDADKRFGGEKDFDGTWAIWDEPFMQFYALKMTEMKQPFVTAIFTASSHHPYVVPEKYSGVYKDEPNPKLPSIIRQDNPIHKCIRYTDMALQKFFETAKKQPWYKNTIFVFTSDHTNINDHQEYATDIGVFGSPLLIYDPSGELPRGRMHQIAQQTDIMPTILNYLGYNRPYVAWGVDLFNTTEEDTWAINYTESGIYQFVKGDYLLQFDGTNLKAVYNFRKDWLLKHNLLPQLRNDKTIRSYERQLKAIIQTYMQRMISNGLVLSDKR